MAERLTSGEHILAHLRDRYRWLGRLSTHQTVDEQGSPLLRVFYRHAPDYELAAPGTRFRNCDDETGLDRWRVRRFPRPINHGKDAGVFVVGLPDVVSSLPADLADWALRAHEQILDGFTGSQAGERLQQELEQARAVTDIAPVPSKYTRFHL